MTKKRRSVAVSKEELCRVAGMSPDDFDTEIGPLIERGLIVQDKRGNYFLHPDAKPGCGVCKTTGKVNGVTCSRCSGEGFVR